MANFLKGFSELSRPTWPTAKRLFQPQFHGAIGIRTGQPRIRAQRPMRVMQRPHVKGNPYTSLRDALRKKI